MIKITVKGLENVIGDFKEKKSSIKKQVKDELVLTAYDIQAEAKMNVQANSSYMGNLANSIEIDTTNDMEVSVFAKAEYAAFIEFGTRKFAEREVAKLPQSWQKEAARFKNKKSKDTFKDFVRKLTEWARVTKKIDPENAYNAAKRIMIEGIQARPYLYPAFNNNYPKLIKRLKEILK